MNAPVPIFEAPWHAQIFAITVHLNETGRFSWTDWAARFGDTLKRHGVNKDLNGGEDYFNAWLETLETYLKDSGNASEIEVATARDAWEKAYLSIPHGATVSLD